MSTVFNYTCVSVPQAAAAATVNDVIINTIFAFLCIIIITVSTSVAIVYLYSALSQLHVLHCRDKKTKLVLVVQSSSSSSRKKVSK